MPDRASDINSLLAAGAGPSRVKTDSKAGTYPDTHFTVQCDTHRALAAPPAQPPPARGDRSRSLISPRGYSRPALWFPPCSELCKACTHTDTRYSDAAMPLCHTQPTTGAHTAGHPHCRLHTHRPPTPRPCPTHACMVM
eukprot:scaffold67628_cov73-Phaeocystis_antarctica.AAC.5